MGLSPSCTYISSSCAFLRHPAHGGVTQDKRTPLHLAAAEGCYSSAAWLLSHGVDVNPIDRFKRTPLEVGAVDIPLERPRDARARSDRTCHPRVPRPATHVAP